MNNQRKLKLLLIKVNPKGTTQLFLDNEQKNLENAKQQSKYEELITIISTGAVKRTEINSHVAINEPDIIHICGHGNEKGEIIFHGENNFPEPIDQIKLIEYLSEYTKHLKFLFFNTCYSMPEIPDVGQNEGDYDLNIPILPNNSPTFIGMKGEAETDIAGEFSKAFYVNFFNTLDVNGSFIKAKKSIALNEYYDENHIRIYENKNIKIDFIAKLGFASQKEDSKEVTITKPPKKLEDIISKFISYLEIDFRNHLKNKSSRELESKLDDTRSDFKVYLEVNKEIIQKYYLVNDLKQQINLADSEFCETGNKIWICS